MAPGCKEGCFYDLGAESQGSLVTESLGYWASPWTRQGFLILDTIDICGQTFPCYGGCLVHCWMFSIIPGLYLLN